MQTGQAIRPVGSCAKFNTSRHANGLLGSVINTCQYTAPVSVLDSGFLPLLIENALATLVLKHPLLAVGIANEGSKDPDFVYLDSIDMREMIEWQDHEVADLGHDEDALTPVLENLHNRTWKDLPQRPGWKLVVHTYSAPGPRPKLPSLDLSFMFHHAYADGPSSVLFHRDFLRALHSVSGSPPELKDSILHMSAPPELPLGIESVVPFKTSWAYMSRLVFTKLVWEPFAPAFLKPAVKPDKIPWTGNPVNPEPFETNLRLIRVPPAALTGLLKACRDHKTTLTPVLHALVLAAFSTSLPAATAPAFNSTTAISLRGYTIPGYDDENTVHCLVTGFTYPFPADVVSQFRDKDATEETLFWPTAKKLSNALRDNRAKIPKDDISGMMGWVSDWDQFWRDQIGKPHGSTWEVSNIGSMKRADARSAIVIKDTPGWEIKRSIFTQGCKPTGPTVGFSVSGVEGEGLRIAVDWQSTIVETSLMEQVVTKFQTYIDNFENTGQFGTF